MQRFELPSSSDGTSSEPPPRKRPREESSETSDGTGTKDSDSVDGSESDSESSSRLLAQKPMANLLLSQMSAFHDDAIESSTKDQSVNARSAMSKKRIAQVLKRPCNCDRKCGKRLSFQVVLATVQLFWSLSKSSQDALLWALQQFQRTANLWFCFHPAACLCKTSLVLVVSCTLNFAGILHGRGNQALVPIQGRGPIRSLAMGLILCLIKSELSGTLMALEFAGKLFWRSWVYLLSGLYEHAIHFADKICENLGSLAQKKCWGIFLNHLTLIGIFHAWMECSRAWIRIIP